MPRFRMTIEYDGSPYVGWQRQENGPSVQGAIEKAILSLSGETVSIRGAGRTDSGVHAMGQVVHADLSQEWSAVKLRNALECPSGAGRRAGGDPRCSGCQRRSSTRAFPRSSGGIIFTASSAAARRWRSKRARLVGAEGT